MQQRNNPFRRAVGARPFVNQRGQAGDNFIDRLIRDANRQDEQVTAGLLPDRQMQPNNTAATENIAGNVISTIWTLTFGVIIKLKRNLVLRMLVNEYYIF